MRSFKTKNEDGNWIEKKIQKNNRNGHSKSAQLSSSWKLPMKSFKKLSIFNPNYVWMRNIHVRIV